MRSLRCFVLLSCVGVGCSSGSDASLDGAIPDDARIDPNAPPWVDGISNRKWTEVSSSPVFVDGIKSVITPSTGYIGSAPIDAIRTAYVAPAWDPATKRWYYFGGGHSDGSVNGIFSFDLRTLTYAQLIAPTPPSAYPPAYTAPNASVVYPSGYRDPNGRFASASALTDSQDTAYAAPFRAPVSKHGYGAFVYTGGKLETFYGGFLEADVASASWTYLDDDIVGPLAHQFQPNAHSGVAMEGTQCAVDPSNGRVYATISPGSAADNWRNFILAIDGPSRSLVYGQNPPSTDYQIVGNESIAVVGRKVLVFGGASMNKTPNEGRHGFWFDADSHEASHAFKLSGEFPTFGGTKQENIPMFSNGTQVFLWNYGRTGDLDALYTFSLTPTGGSGTGADPYLYASTKIVLDPSGMPTPDMTYRLDYISDWGVVVVQASSSSKVWALRL